MKKFEKVTDGNLWAGSQHWKKVPGIARKEGNIQEKRKVTFQEDTGDVEKKKKTVKKDRIFIDFTLPPNVDAIFEQKKSKVKRTNKKSPADPFQMSKAGKDFLLPPDANVGASALTRLFSRPNAVVQKDSSTVSKTATKTVGFCDLEENALGFDCENDFASGDNESGGFTVAYGDDDEGHMHDDVDYRTDNFDEVRKVQKIDINYATVAKKVDVRRLKRDLWIELEEKTTPEDHPEKDTSGMNETHDDIHVKQSQSGLVSFKETVEKMEQAQSQHDVTVSFYFICCLHLANEKGLKLDSTGLEDFMISLDQGSSTFKETFGDNFVKTANELSSKSRKHHDIQANDEYDE
jgi:condensin complex subunit 2